MSIPEFASPAKETAFVGSGAPTGLRSSTIYLAIAIAIALYFGRLMGAFTRFPGLTLDARFNQIVLEQFWNWASGRTPSLSDPPFFYPFRAILYFSDTHLGSGWIYAISRALGAPREVAFDLWFLAGMASTFAAAAYAFRRLGLPKPSAAFGACVFAFSLPMLAQDDHAQLVYRFAVPLATLAILDWIRAPSARSFALLVLWVSWQFLCSVYIGVFLMEWLAVLAPVAFLVGDVGTQKAAAPTSDLQRRALYVAATLAGGLAIYLLWRHAQTARDYAIHRDIWEIEAMAPRWTSLLSMQGAATAAWLQRLLPTTTFRPWEHQLFPGFGVLLLAAAGAWHARADRESRRVAIVCLIGIAWLLALTVNFGGIGLYRYVAEFPGLNAIRSPGRIVLVAAFPLAWLAALGLTALRRNPTPAARALLTVGLGVALLDIASFRPAYVEIAAARARVAAMAQGLDGEALRARRAVLLRFGDTSDEEETLLDIDLTIAAQDLGLSTINGYSGSIPQPYKRPRNCEEARAWLAEVDTLAQKRAGADDVAARTAIVPLGACGK